MSRVVSIVGVGLLLSVAAFGGIVYDEGVLGDLSNFPGTPSGPIPISDTSNLVIGTIGAGTGGLCAPGDVDCQDIFTVVALQPILGIGLDNLVLTGTPNNVALFEIYSGVTAVGAPLGSAIIGNVDVGADLLALSGLGPLAGGGASYTILLRESDSTGQAWQFDLQSVPEPGTYVLVGFGLAGLALIRRRRRA